MNPQIVQAINSRKVLRINYKGGIRIVEPYVYGVSRAGNDVLRAYQRSGASSSNEAASWKMFTISSITTVEMSAESFSLRPEYNAQDRDLIKVYACAK